MKIKPVSEWTESDLLELISIGEQESITLDYKQSDALIRNSDSKKKELGKDVSAFANSAGGTLIYGIREDKHVPIGIDDGFDPSEISKEWIEQVINSRIQQRIDGIIVRQIALKTHRPGRVAYAISIPQSSRAPHQTDHRFYKRFNFESIPMEEYEIRDVARRLEAPDLQVEFKIEPDTGPKSPADLHLGRANVMPIISNQGPVPAEYAVISLVIDSKIQLVSPPRTLISGGHMMLGAPEEVPIPCTRWDIHRLIPADMPIFYGAPLHLFEKPLVFGFVRPGEYSLGWKVMTPRMRPTYGGIVIKWNGDKASIVSE